MIPHSRPTFDETDCNSAIEIIQSGCIIQGEKVSELEKSLASYIGVKDGVAVSSGTAALHLALLALNVRERNEVILPTYICIAPLNAIYYTGAKPVLVDINEGDFNISISDVKKKLTKYTKAIIVPHMFGLPAEMDEILSIGVPVIEDCAHSIGARYKNLMAGSLGVLSVFSFYATKMLATGEGGMVLSNDKRLISKIKDIRDYDEKEDFRVRFNYKMTDMEAALGLNQLKKLPSFIQRRESRAEKYNKAFSECSFTIPAIHIGRIFYRYVIRVERNAELYINEARNKGVECRKPVYKPLHQYFGLKGFPTAERIHGSAISIPIYPSLTDEEVNFIIDIITSIR